MSGPVAAILIATQADPAPLPAPAASPARTVQCGGRCLAGIAIGDDKNRVLSALGSQAIPGSDDRIFADFNSYPDGLMLTVYYQKNIVAISVTNISSPGNTKITDPYGVKLNDASDRLISLRGKPDATDGGVWRYGTSGTVHWDYTIQNGVVTTILVSSVPKLP